MELADINSTTSLVADTTATTTTTLPSYIFHSRPFIQAGDVVIVYMKRDFIQAITITPGQFIHNKFGKYSHSQFIGQKFGSRITSLPPSIGFIHLLRPTSELWTLSLPHRTQILYLPDISLIVEKLDIRVGSKVIEAGTGSGSMTHSLGRNVRGVEGGGVVVEEGGEEWMEGNGKGVVFSYEYHQERFEKAKVEFYEHGMNDTIHLRHRNVCKEGFGKVGNGVDSVFLDLPAPWEAIPHAVNALRSDVVTRICCFSPCIEQVTRTVTALDAEGFTDIEMHEVLTRAHEIQSSQPKFPTISSISIKLREHSVKKEERRQFQIKSARARKLAEEKRKEEAERGEGEGGEEEKDGEEGESKKREREVGDEVEETPRKKSKLNKDINNNIKDPNQIKEETPSSSSQPAVIVDEEDLGNESNENEDGEENDDEDEDNDDSEPWKLSYTSLIAKPVPEMRGHTSYLTFAVLYPKAVREEIASRPNRMRQGRSLDVSGIASPAVRAETREGSVGSDVSDSLARAIASMTEEELMGMA